MTGRLVERAIVWGATAAAAATVLLVLNVDLFLGHALRDDYRIAVGIVLVANGLPLVAFPRARAVLAARLLRGAAPRGRRRRRLREGLAHWLVVLAAVVWVGAGLFELLRAAFHG